MSIIVSNCQHCDELNDFLNTKVRFIPTSTVTGSDSFPGKNTRTSCLHSEAVVLNLFNKFIIQWSHYAQFLTHFSHSGAVTLIYFIEIYHTVKLLIVIDYVS